MEFHESPYAPPKSELEVFSSEGLRTYKRYVVYEPGTQWPDRCFKCNAETSVKKKTTVTYINPWIYVSILINFIITLILALIFRKQFKIDLPICQEHIQKRKIFLFVLWSFTALSLLMFGIGLVSEEHFFTFIGLALFLVVLFLAIGGRQIHAAKLKHDQVWIMGTGAAFRDSLPQLGND